jgi:hypothetical protein
MQVVLYSPTLGTLDLTASAANSGLPCDLLLANYDMGLLQPELSTIQAMFGDIQTQTGYTDRTPVFHVVARAEAEADRAAGGEAIAKWINAGDCELRYTPTDGPTSCLLVLSGYASHVAAPNGSDDRFVTEWQGTPLRWFEVHLTTAPQVLAAEATTATLSGSGLASGVVTVEGTFPAAATVVATASAGLGETIVYTGPNEYDPAMRSRVTTDIDGEPITLQRVNLMPNPSFEAGTTGWAAGTNTSSIQQWSNPGAQGSFINCTGSNLLRALNTATTGGLRSYVNSPAIGDITPGQKYAIQARIGCWFATTAGFLARFFDATGKMLVESTASGVVPAATGSGNDLVTTLVPISGVFEAPAEAASLTIYPFATATSTTLVFFVDAVMVEESDTVRDYFDGDTAASDGWSYSWSGTAGESTSIAQTSVDTVVSRPDAPHFYKGTTDWVRLDLFSFSVSATDLPEGDYAFIANVADVNGIASGKTILPALTIQTLIGGNVVDVVEAGALGVTITEQDSLISLGSVTIDRAGIGSGAESSATINVTVSDPSGALYFDEIFMFRIDPATSLTMVDAGAGSSALGAAHSRVTVTASPRPGSVPTVTRGLSSDPTRYVGPGVTLAQMEPPMMQPGDNFVYVASAGVDDTVNVAISYRSAHSTYVDAA